MALQITSGGHRDIFGLSLGSIDYLVAPSPLIARSPDLA
ncbi:unnamed protein product [Acidithrix sp. C25]|nr:unnamed protein product [Acidithrix sp. C25]